MLILGIIAAILIGLSVVGKIPGSAKAVRTSSEKVEVFQGLIRAGLSTKAALMALAQAVKESYISGKLRSYGYNYWNFGVPPWWGEYDRAGVTGFAERPQDDVRGTITFPNLASAVSGYIEILRRGRPTAYGEIQKESPDINRFVTSLCPEYYGATGNPYATACSIGYGENIRTIYNRLLEEYELI